MLMATPHARATPNQCDGLGPGPFPPSNPPPRGPGAGLGSPQSTLPAARRFRLVSTTERDVRPPDASGSRTFRSDVTDLSREVGPRRRGRAGRGLSPVKRVLRPRPTAWTESSDIASSAPPAPLMSRRRMCASGSESPLESLVGRRPMGSRTWLELVGAEIGRSGSLRLRFCDRVLSYCGGGQTEDSSRLGSRHAKTSLKNEIRESLKKTC
jgi:hypothetical protein